MDLLANKRQQSIQQLLTARGSITTAELTELFGVSIETVRRDLLLLEQQGVLQRVHGGAVPVSKMKHLAELPQRLEENKQEKQALCETAAWLVEDQDVICIDSGATAVYFAEALKRRHLRLTIITHSADVFDIFRDEEQVSVILCGGHYMKQERAFYGTLTLDMLDRLHAAKGFLFPSAISLQGGICDFNHELLAVQQKMFSRCSKVYFLAESQKFEKRGLLKLMNADGCSLVSDCGLSAELKQRYAERGVTVITTKEELP